MQLAKSLLYKIVFQPLTLYQRTNFFYWIKLKAFAIDKINVTQKLTFVLERVENFFGKGENAGYLMFSKAFFFRVVKSWDCVVRV